MFEKEIKAELKKRGLDESLFDKIKVEKEDQIVEAVYDLKLQEEITKGVKSQIDSEVTKAIKTREENLTKQIRETLETEYKTKLEAELKAKLNPPKPGDTPDIAKLIQESLSPLTQKIEELEEVKKKEARDKTVLSKLKAAELPESWAPHITAMEEDKIDEQVNSVKEQIDAMRQAEIDKLLKENGTPFSGNKKVAGDALVESIANERNKGSAGGDFLGVDIDGKLKAGDK